MTTHLNTLTPGLIGIQPRIVYMRTTENLATITTAGFMNKLGQVLQGFNILKTDEIHTIYSYNPNTGTGTFGIFLPTFSAIGQITLSQWIDAGNVLLPVVGNNLAMFNGTSGQITDSGIAFNQVMKLNVINQMSGVGAIVLPKSNGTEAANAVTTTGVAGVITTSSLTTAGGASYAITWTNTLITPTSVIVLTTSGGTNTTQNFRMNATSGSSTSTLTIYNNTAATAFNGTILINYLIM